MRELARLAGVSKAILSQVERGRMIPTGEEFIRVTAALEKVASEVAGREPGPTPATSPTC